MNKRLYTAILSVGFGLVSFGLAETAYPQDIVYTPINPSFGGNPFNSAHLLSIANAQNDFEPEPAETSTQSDLDRFIRSLQSRLLSSLSSQVANAIFGEDAQDEGTIVFGDQTISFVRGLDGIELTITEADGSQTVITVPVFTSTASAPDGTTPTSSPTESGAAPQSSLVPRTSLTALPQLGQSSQQSSLLSPPPLSSGLNQPIQ